jgi:gliding motility-associated-like protein
VFTPNPNQCATPVTLNVTITNSIVPNFTTSATYCTGSTIPALVNTSPNGITGTWSPATVNNTTSGSYVFTPNPNQCATPITLNVTITNSIVPNFATSATYCTGSSIPALVNTSPNGITGTWSPATVSNTASGSYVFTPNPNQCATPVTLNVTITISIVPNFATSATYCTGSTIPALVNTSPNGITGSWSPATVNNTTSGSYVFTPNPNQCATPVTLNVTITNSIVPNFATSATYCTGSTIPALVNTSPNGITGTWNPATVSNTASGSYVFTPNPNHCATPITLNVTIDGISGTISGPSSLCAQEVDTFTVSVSGGTWQSNDTSIATIDQNGMVTAIAAGTVTIIYSIPGSCTSIISTNLTVFPLPQPILESAFICVDPTTGITLEPAVLNCGLSASTHSFSWTLDGNLLPTTTPTHLATTTGVYQVVATHLVTGCSNTISTTVTNSSSALATAIIAVDFALQQTITITITGGSGNYIYQLNDGPWQTQPVFTGVPEGENNIGIQDLNGCGIIYVTVYSLNYPRFFTSNGDGFNDTWNISGITEQPNALIAIFDRYGKLLKTIKASEGRGWDGTYNGEPLPATDYWFSLEYVNRNGIANTFKAHFSLKR